MVSIFKNTSMLDILITFAVILAAYLIFLHFYKPMPVYKPLKGHNPNRELAKVKKSRRSYPKRKYNNKPVTRKNKSALTKGYDGKARKDLHGSSNVKNYHLLKKGEVLDKKNYICNPECPCDERTVGESLKDIRNLFITKDKHQLGNVTDMKGTLLKDSFKLGDGKEHRCQPKPMDVELISKLLNCKGKQN